MSEFKSYPKYWMCSPCAKERNGESENKIVTVVAGKCSWCNLDKLQTLTPLRDFHWPLGRPDEGEK